MQSQNRMMVVQTELVEDGTIDSGLILVTAEPIADEGEPVVAVEFLTNLRDGWWVGRTITVTVEWEPTENEHENSNWSSEYLLERSCAASGLDPSQFTEESVEDAEFTE